MKLIPKYALIAEIEEWLTEIEKLSHSKEAGDEYGKGFCDGRRGAYRKILSSISSLGVKEGDLDEQDIYSILYFERIVMREWGDHEYSNEGLCREILKRYKAQKGV